MERMAESFSLGQGGPGVQNRKRCLLQASGLIAEATGLGISGSSGYASKGTDQGINCPDLAEQVVCLSFTTHLHVKGPADR